MSGNDTGEQQEGLPRSVVTVRLPHDGVGFRLQHIQRPRGRRREQHIVGDLAPVRTGRTSPLLARPDSRSRRGRVVVVHRLPADCPSAIKEPGRPQGAEAMSEFPTSVVFHDRGIESVEAVHGHGGKTRIEWLDG